MKLSNQLSCTLAAALLLAALLPNPAKADAEVDRMIRMQKNCDSGIGDSKSRADTFKDYLKKPALGFKESAANKQTYNDALTSYNTYKKGGFKDDARTPGYSQDRYEACSGAADGFKQYYTDMDIDNAEAYRKWQASQTTLTPAQAKIKTALDACIVKLAALQASNNKLRDDSKAFFGAITDRMLKAWKPVDDKINGFKTYATTYTDANLLTCQTIAADTSVAAAYTTEANLKSQQGRSDAAKDKADADAKQAKADQASKDAEAKIKAGYAAQQKAIADQAAADNAKLPACLKDVKDRRDAIGARFSAVSKSSIFTEADFKMWNSLTSQVDPGTKNMLQSKATTLQNCESGKGDYAALEKFVAGLEAKNAVVVQAAAEKAKAAADQAAARKAVADQGKLVASLVASVPPRAVACAKDGQQCQGTGNWAGYYGANGKFAPISGSGSFTCLPGTFGIPDPFPGAEKTCYVIDLVASAPQGTEPCATDSNNCQASGNWTGVYGVPGKYVQISGSGAFTCLSNTFGVPDPAPGVLKTCHVSAGAIVKAPAAAATTGSAFVTSIPADATACATDGKTCTRSGSWTGVYGVNGKYVKISGSNSFVCLPGNLKVDDPVPGVLKTCYVTATATAPAPTPPAGPSALKALVDRCSASLEAATRPIKCPLSTKDPNYRSCISSRDATGGTAFAQCMNSDGRGKCVLIEMGVPRAGKAGQSERYGALLKCGYSSREVDDLGGWVTN